MKRFVCIVNNAYAFNCMLYVDSGCEPTNLFAFHKLMPIDKLCEFEIEIQNRVNNAMPTDNGP